MRILSYLLYTAATLMLASQHQAVQSQVVHPHFTSQSALLHNGWKLSPAGAGVRVADMPLGCSLSPDGALLAITCGGFNDHHFTLIDAKTGKIKQDFPQKNAWNGVAWASDSSKVYACGGSVPKIFVYSRTDNGEFRADIPISVPGLATKTDATHAQCFLSGLALSSDGKTLFAGNFATDTIFAFDTTDGSVARKVTLVKNAHPYCLRLSSDGTELYVTQGAMKSIAVLNTADLSTIKIITTEQHPNDILLHTDGRMFVSCGSSSSVLAIDSTSGETKERISLSLTPKSPSSATPCDLAVSPDGKTLYVTNSDNNDVGVIDISSPGHSAVKGFLPTGWYPTSVAVSSDGASLFINTGKGLGYGPNADRSKNPKPDTDRGYIYGPTLMYGIVTKLDVPDSNKLAAYTRQVMSNTPYRDALIMRPLKAPKPGTNPIPSRLGDPSPIKHILYIIKENRSYDQVMGDIKGGNGDPSLTIFGEKITPNIHALAKQYVLLDNLYCNGDVSGNGHPWSTAAYGTDIGERSWMLDYGGKAPWSISDLDLYPPVGRIWDVCERMGKTFASYYYTWTTSNTHRHMPADWEKVLNQKRDFENAAMFASDLHKYEKNNNLPDFMIMSLREDHTSGTSPKSFTPQACVASNDLGVGKIVEACSHSKYWNQMAIFIIQDDSQDGPDHIDAHRTEALVISPYTRKHIVDSTFYTTSSMLRSMELILGLPPMSQYDASATPMYHSFQAKPDLTPYKALPARIDVMAKNKPNAIGAKESMKMDFSDVDRLTFAQVDQLNRILWHTMKGAHTPYPSISRQAAFHRNGEPVIDVAKADSDD